MIDKLPPRSRLKRVFSKNWHENGCVRDIVHRTRSNSRVWVLPLVENNSGCCVNNVAFNIEDYQAPAQPCECKAFTFTVLPPQVLRLGRIRTITINNLISHIMCEKGN